MGEEEKRGLGRGGWRGIYILRTSRAAASGTRRVAGMLDGLGLRPSFRRYGSFYADLMDWYTALTGGDRQAAR